MGKEASSALAAEDKGSSMLDFVRLKGEVTGVVGSTQVAMGRGIDGGYHGFELGRHMRAVGTSCMLWEPGTALLHAALSNEDMVRSGSSWCACGSTRSEHRRGTRSLCAERVGVARPEQERTGEKWLAG
jgi:hypothetical protein